MAGHTHKGTVAKYSEFVTGFCKHLLWKKISCVSQKMMCTRIEQVFLAVGEVSPTFTLVISRTHTAFLSRTKITFLYVAETQPRATEPNETTTKKR